MSGAKFACVGYLTLIAQHDLVKVQSELGFTQDRAKDLRIWIFLPDDLFDLVNELLRSHAPDRYGLQTSSIEVEQVVLGILNITRLTQMSEDSPLLLVRPLRAFVKV